LHAAAEEMFQISDQTPRKPWSSFAGDVDQQVHIALRAIIPASHRAEKQDVARPVVHGHSQDVIATFSNVLSNVHSSSIVPSARLLTRRVLKRLALEWLAATAASRGLLQSLAEKRAFLRYGLPGDWASSFFT
jgi:hypothetical protein